MNKQDQAIATLRKGPKAIDELEAQLEDMSIEERRALAAQVKAMGINAPRIVFYDYQSQQWLIN